MEFSDQIQFGITLITELSTQLMTLATGVFALTVTFLKGKHNGATKFQKFLRLSWLLYLLSIFFGIWTLMALSGSSVSFDNLRKRCEPTCRAQYQDAKKEGRAFDIAECDQSLKFDPLCSARAPSAAQILTFLAGSLLVILYGSKVLSTRKEEDGAQDKAPLVKLIGTLSSDSNSAELSSLEGTFEIALTEPSYEGAKIAEQHPAEEDPG